MRLRNIVAVKHIPKAQCVAVPAARMDDLLVDQGMSLPSLIKIDVEGAEPLALKGLSGCFAGRDLPLFIVEIYVPGLQRMGSGPEDVICHFPLDRFYLWHIHLSRSDLRHDLALGKPYALPNPVAHQWPYLSNLIALPKAGAFANRRCTVEKILHCGM